MPKSKKLEAEQALLQSLRADPVGGAQELAQLLTSRQSLVVAPTAKLIGESELMALAPDLEAAFGRLMAQPASADPGCLAKFRIAEALYRLEASAEAVFLAGIRHVQPEPVWGGQQDTAGNLRGVCALGLVRMHYSGVMVELADLLADPESSVRAAAARALAYADRPDSLSLLRFKAHIGDEESAVMGDVFSGLLQLDRVNSPAFVARWLAEGALGEQAALALGESKLAEALPLLQAWWQRSTNPESRQSAMLSIAMLRADRALDWLIDQVQTGAVPDAKAAIVALSLYQSDGRLWQRVEGVVADRGDGAIAMALRQVG
jgi:hypothetical protein